MYIIVLIALVIFLVISPTFRCAFFHPVLLVLYGIRDGVKYIKTKAWNNASYGQILCYVADNSTSFGCGKTLSASVLTGDFLFLLRSELYFASRSNAEEFLH